MSININSDRFKKLLEDRKAWVDATNRNEFPVEEVLSNFYSDSSHFVFELLQNAEDANAKKVKFDLSSEKIKFSHDGVDFNFDDLNSITSIGNSNKVDDYTKIGEHGVGFKSVLSLTKSPIIRSGNVEFEITDMVFPVFKDGTYEGENTEIILPFNRNRLDTNLIVSNIYNKISNLGLRNILFLNNIEIIEWEFEQDSGVYTKTEQNNYLDQPVSKRTISYDKNTDSEKIASKEIYLVFSEKINIEEKNLQTDVAYVIEDNDGEDVIGKVEDSKVSVFFETEHETHLNFLIQAMFSTTSTRERIPLNPENSENIKLLDHIADITANSLEILKKLNLYKTEVLGMMPLDADENPIPNVIYEKIKDKLLSGAELLPNKFGSFGNSQNTLLTSHAINKLFNEKQISELFEKSYFVDDCYNVHSGKIYNYLKTDIGLEVVDLDVLSSSISKDFFEDQTDEWMMDFYKEIYDIESLWKNRYVYNSSPPLLERKYLIRGEDGKHYNALDDNGDEEIYFYSNDDTHEFPTVKKIFCEEEQIVEIFNDLGVKDFDELSYIKKYILKKYKEDDIQLSSADFRSHINRINEYYEKINSDSEDSNTDAKNFLNLLEKRMLFSADFNNADVENNKKWAKVHYLYFPNVLIVEYFEDSTTPVAFVKQNDLDEIPGYKELLTKLNVKTVLRLVNHPLSISEKHQIIREEGKSASSYGENNEDWTFRDLNKTLENINPNKSILIWESIVNLSERYYKANFTYFWYNNTRLAYHTPRFINLLKNHPWLYIEGTTYKPSEIIYEDLDNKIYNNLNVNEEFIELLGFKRKTHLPEEALELLDEKQKEKYKQFEEFQKYVTDDEAKSIIAEKKQEKRKSIEEIEKNILEEIKLEVIDNFSEGEEQPASGSSEQPDAGSLNEYEVGEIVESDVFGRGEVSDVSGEGENQRISVSFDDKSERDLVPKFANLKKIDSTNVSSNISNKVAQESFSTEQNLQRSIKTDRTKIANIHNILEKKLNLQTLLDYEDKLDKYTFAWFKLLLNIEYESAKQNMHDNKTLKIFFSKVISLNDKIILLKNPSRNIPSFIEDLPSVNLIIKNKKKREGVKVDVVSLRDNTIKLKLINPIQTISINESTTAEMDINDPFFLIKELMKEFSILELDHDFNYKNDVENDIEFIFGPPGTGKTTEIAEQINQGKNRDKKILLLAPTNKAADVLCRKIISIADSDYANWLIRFGNTGVIDDEINSIVKNREYNIEDLESFVVISTIARLPYDGFSNDKLNEIEWDEVYFDEASMIHLSYVAYAMKKLKSNKLYFAGDPNQITPIMEYQDWEKQNIYEMFELSDFDNPITKPKSFSVKTLNTQYRSVKDIGDLFSHYAYSGKVESKKEIAERKSLSFTKENLKPFSIMRFPIDKYDRLLKRERLIHSPYHIYAAIYSIEIVKYISDKINVEWPDKIEKKKIDDDLDIDALNASKWTIGIICPYKAQSSIIERLIPERKDDDKFVILCGTVHSFQGDECDIVISLFNPPPSISPLIALNNKNIMNVSISRAKQYQILIVPDEDTFMYEDLEEINKIIGIIKDKYPDEYDELGSDKMEEILFGEKNYIRNNSMVTKHQKINRYNEADYRWEVRCDEEAVDIHISRNTSGSNK